MSAKIVAIGACVADTLISLPRYPEEDTKLRADGVRLSGGGPAATGIVAAAKLGKETAFLGVLSDDAGGAFLLEDFRRYGVNTDRITVEKGYRSFTSVVLLSAAAGTRTCVFDKGTLPPMKLNKAQKQAVADADVLMIDGNEMDAAEEACRIAKEHNTTVLYDCGGRYEGVERLLRLTDVMIPSEEFALGHTGRATAEEAAKELFARYSPRFVVITQGKRGGLLYDGASITGYPIFPANVVDSNGSGDVFHGAFAAALTEERSPMECCLFASAVSALKCTGIGARASVPDRETVIRFMKENGYEL